MESVVKAEKQKVVECFTCPLCNHLFDSATTISECLHTFCRKCIYDKIKEENLRACPVCNVDLGVSPLDKLRSDNSWNDMRLKLFPPKQASLPLQSHASLSSLFANSVTVSSKTSSRKLIRKKKNGTNRLEQKQEQSLKGSENDSQILLNSDQLNGLVSQNGDTEEVSGERLKSNGEEKQEHVLNSGERELRPRRRRKRTDSGGSSTPEEEAAMETEARVEGSNNPVWFSLVASEDQNTDRPLPQISPCYLRVNNGDLTVSYVKKYLVKKLSLQSENEVEIWLRNEPVCPRLKLHHLVDWWVHTTPIDQRESSVPGSSASKFIMVLFYSSSLPSP